MELTSRISDLSHAANACAHTSDSRKLIACFISIARVRYCRFAIRLIQLIGLYLHGRATRYVGPAICAAAVQPGLLSIRSMRFSCEVQLGFSCDSDLNGPINEFRFRLRELA